MVNKEVEDGKICAILAYFLIGIIWYFVDEKMKKNKFVNFHVKQGLILLIASIIVQVVGTMIPFLGWFIILPLGSLFLFIVGIIGLINAIKGINKPMPIIGKYGEKFTF